MNADKKYARRGLEGAPRATAMPADESLPRYRLAPTSRDVLPDPEMAAMPAWRHSTAENKLRIQELADACTTVDSLGALLLAE